LLIAAVSSAKTKLSKAKMEAEFKAFKAKFNKSYATPEIEEYKKKFSSII